MTTATHTEPAPHASRRRVALPRLALWLPLLVAGGFYAAFIARSSFSFQGRTYFTLFDDAMISMRYAQNFAAGHGLVWNPGQHVEGYSNFLWTLWMSVIHLLGLPDRYTSLAVMVGGAVLLVLNLLVVRRLSALLVPGSPLAGVLAMTMTALFYPLVFWALRGMEVALAAFLTSLAALLVLELRDEWSVRRCWALAAMLGAAALTRDDLLVPCVVVLAWVAWQFPREIRRRTLLIVGGTVAALIVGHELFRLAYYGDALPNTYYLKLGGISIGDRLVRGIESLLYASLYSLSVPLLLAGAALALRWRSSGRAPLALLAGLVTAQCAYSVYVGGDAWEDVRFANRYVATAAPMLMVLAAVGAHDLVAAASRSTRVAIRAVAAFASLGVLLLLLHAADWVPHGRLGFPGPPVTQLTPAFVLLGCAVAIAAVALLAHRAEVRLNAAAALALALLAVAATSADPLTSWVRSNAQDLALERVWTETGVAIGHDTAPGTAVAMAAAGNMAYFGGRPAIDLLGKMDPVVAHRAPTSIVPIRYRPGHNKWDYDHSIRQLRPPVVASLWWALPSDLCNMERWGYRQIAPRFYVLRGVRGVSEARLAEAIRRLVPGPGYPPPAAGCA
jgi:hypothetical protein